MIRNVRSKNGEGMVKEKFPKMKFLKYVLCSFAAVWLPVRMLASWIGIESLLDLMAHLGEFPRYLSLLGVLLLLVDLWQSKKTQDDKIWWTVLGLIAFPIVAPAYWFGYGINHLHSARDPETSARTQPETMT